MTRFDILQAAAAGPPLTRNVMRLGADVSNVESELSSVWPNATQCKIGKHDVYLDRMETPAHKYVAIIKVLDTSRLVELTARDSYDDRLAEFLLDRSELVAAHPPTANTVRVFQFEYPLPWQFQSVVVVPPSIAARFETKSAALNSATYWLCPAFRGEFTDGDKGKQFWHQVGRKDGWRSDVVKWTRSQKMQPAFD